MGLGCRGSELGNQDRADLPCDSHAAISEDLHCGIVHLGTCHICGADTIHMSYYWCEHSELLTSGYWYEHSQVVIGESTASY